MNKKINFGNLVIIVLLLLTFFLWFFLRIETQPFKDIKTTIHSLGQVFSLLATVMFSILFVMITRIDFIQKSFGGLDKMYKTHQIIARTAFLLILLHPILLILKSYPYMWQTLKYFFSFSSLAISSGVIALILLTILIILTVMVKMKYHHWKISHKFMGLFFAIALFHIFKIGSDIGKYPLLKYYMVIISSIGSIAFIYAVIFKRFLKKRVKYYVESMSTKNNITLLNLKTKNKKLNYKPGQFVFIKIIDKKISKEQHPFTISSSALDNNIEFAIKNLGDYTSELPNISVGSEVELEGPYGFFGEFNPSNKQIWISGGIGITPFLSMIKTLALSKKDFKSIDFYYCVKNESEAIFLDSLKKLTSNYKKINIIPWYSESKGPINSEYISSYSNIKDSEIRICGPPSMMKSLAKQFISNGVKRSRIFFEDFDLK